MSKNPFVSKSSQRVPIVADKVVKKQLILRDAILWYGKKDVLFNHGKSFHYQMIESIPDISCLLQVNAVVLQEAALNPYLSQINFAVNYDVPVIWVHSHLIPHSWMWSFKLCYVGKTEVLPFWGSVCEMIV